MKCPHCDMDDLKTTSGPKLKLLSFVFVTVRCPHCSGVFAVPEKRRIANSKDAKAPKINQRRRHAA